jgi:hypothetical protein
VANKSFGWFFGEASVIRQRLYLSTGKLDSFYVRSGGISITEAEFGASAGVVSGRVTAGPKVDAKAALETKMMDVSRFLERSARPFTHPALRPGEWLRFDLEMAYGSSGEDRAMFGVPDDVVLFGGEVNRPAPGDNRPLALLLCGSACYMTDRIASAGRLGSGTGWLYRLIKQVNDNDVAGSLDLPIDFTSPHVRSHRGYTLEHMAQDVSHWFLRDHPPKQRPRLAGLAQVLLHADEVRWSRRLLVATPLYVEFGGFTPARRFSRFLRSSMRHARQRDIDA